MNTFVQHVDAEQQLETAAVIVCLEGRKFFAGLRVAGVGLINIDVSIDSRKPLRHMGQHFVHMFLAGAEHNVLSSLFCDMLCKDPVEAVGLFQCPAQGIEIFLVHILHPGAAHTVHTSLVLCQFVLIPEHGGDILWGR